MDVAKMMWSTAKSNFPNIQLKKSEENRKYSRMDLLRTTYVSLTVYDKTLSREISPHEGE